MFSSSGWPTYVADRFLEYDFIYTCHFYIHISNNYLSLWKTASIELNPSRWWKNQYSKNEKLIIKYYVGIGLVYQIMRLQICDRSIVSTGTQASYTKLACASPKACI